ncbi:MAG TPA: kelch repeat-containing protein [Anaerolineae bacterium]|nr:kelch repeat-containing protein [Anaerolineae bacterium]
MMRPIRFSVLAVCLLTLLAPGEQSLPIGTTPLAGRPSPIDDHRRGLASAASAASQTPAQPNTPNVPTCLFVGPTNPPQTYAQLHAPMPTARHSFGTAALPGQTYVFAIGGMQGWETAVAANERFDACADTWQTLAPLPAPRGYVQAVEMNSFIYVVGGVTQVVSNTYSVESTAFMYHPALDWWLELERLPAALGGVAVAAYQGKLYAFGGFDTRGPGSGDVNAAYEYNPTSHQWSALPTMPGGARSLAGAAELNGEIYVVGGMAGSTHGLIRVEAYNPLTREWRTVASLGDARHSLTVVKAPDGYLYAAGGAESFMMWETPQRYDPVANTWTYLDGPRLNDYFDHGAAGVALAAGRLFVLGGIYPRYGIYQPDALTTNVNESLRLFDSVCDATVTAQPARVEPGGRITYTIALRPDVSTRPNVSLVDPLPAGTTFGAFVAQPPGAVFNAGQNRVEWQGALLAGQSPITITFAASVAAAGWSDGQSITNTVSIDKGSGPLIQRSVATPVQVFDLSPSRKWVERAETPVGQTLTYTIRVQSVSSASGAAALVDPIPIDTTYVTGSVTSTIGAAGHGDGRIVWNGSLPYPATYTNRSGDYQWGDSITAQSCQKQ